jgi:archaellum component FlaD/FlaE
VRKTPQAKAEAGQKVNDEEDATRKAKEDVERKAGEEREVRMAQEESERKAAEEAKSRKEKGKGVGKRPTCHEEGDQKTTMEAQANLLDEKKNGEEKTETQTGKDTDTDCKEEVQRPGTPETGNRLATAMTPPPVSNAPRRLSSSLDDVPLCPLDKELREKHLAKYDLNAEEEAAMWIEAITGAHVAGNFSEALRSGKVLCELVNKIRPGTITNVRGFGMPFKERENISQFLRACRTFGVQEYMLFSTDDLYEEKNLLSVVKCLHALGGAVQRTVPDFQGPTLGVLDTSNAKRDLKRHVAPATQTGGFAVAMEKVTSWGGR